MDNIKSLDVVPLYNQFRKALENEDYELCAKIQKEFKYRKKNNLLCPYSVMMLKKSTYPLYDLFD